MRLIDLPPPGVFAGSATLRKDLVRAINFAKIGFCKHPDKTPEIVKSLTICLEACLKELQSMNVDNTEEEISEKTTKSKEAKLQPPSILKGK